jgi:hypothetical protein
MVAAPCVVTLLGALSWSSDTTRFRFFVFVVLVYRDFLLFIFDLLVKGFSLHLLLVGYCGFIYKT